MKLLRLLSYGHRRTRPRARDRDRPPRGAGPRSGARRGAGEGAGARVTGVFTEPLLGWRLWQVRPHDDGFRLESLTWHHVAWPARRRLEASCPVHRDAAPAAGHECGIYAFRTR